MIDIRMDPAIATWVAASMALLFAAAAVHKLRDLRAFAGTFSAYELLPARFQQPLAPQVPVLEAAVAIGLLFDVWRTRHEQPPSAGLATRRASGLRAPA
jgi:hypothetical protein